ncbi:Cell division control protein 1 [Candida viswanathii]|uniref:Cell division control protein 1 n=1 Tax=Candida viswanathii TaxID=5486 RepID=A0A367XT13_9ASCO|nr:Cell division control protein 1 [Candida viswanathii]
MIRKRFNDDKPVESEPEQEEKKEKLQKVRAANWKLLPLVAVLWIGIVHLFERTIPSSVISKCLWNNWESWQSPEMSHRIVLIADPQIVDDYSYPKQSRVLNFFIKRLADNYLHRNYELVDSILDQNTTIFLGDLFDGGRYWDDDQWLEEFHRFNRVFPKKQNRKDIRSIPGNHDIGFQTIHPHVLKRFAKHYGPSNDYLVLGNHSFVLFDSISLSHPDEEINSLLEEFLSGLNDMITNDYPRVLLTHVPLYRFPDTQLCGPKREKSHRPFPLQRGDQYQTVIEYEISKRMLNTIRPVLIFAGDDHDYCDITQPYDNGGVAREITVKSAAMTGGIKHPAFQLLSLNTNDEGSETFQTEMCYMPNAFHGVYAYLAFLVISSIILKNSTLVLLNVIFGLFIVDMYHRSI